MKLYLLSIFPDDLRSFPSKKIRSLGTLSVAAAISGKFTKEQVELVCIEGNGRESASDFIELLNDATHVGFSLYAWSSEILCEVAKALKSRNVALFAGGNDVTYYTDRFEQMNLFDVLVVGEGELGALDTIDKWLKGEKQDRIVDIPIPYLTNLPSPWLSEFVDLSVLSTLSSFWELSRGCPFRCSYCCISWGYKPGLVRHFSKERIQNEIEVFKNYGDNIGQIFVLDSTFNYDKKKAIEILKQLALNISNVPFVFCVRSEFLDDEIISYLGKLNNILIRYGIQSIHTKVLKNINRAPIDREHLIKIQELCDKYGVKVGVDLILGLPSDTFDGFCESVDFISSLGVHNIISFTLMLPPVSDLYKKREEWNMNIMKEYPNFIMSTDTMSEDDMARATRVSMVCNAIYNDGIESGTDVVSMLDVLNMKPSEFMEQLGEYIGVQANSRTSILDAKIENIKERALEFLERLYVNKIEELT